MAAGITGVGAGILGLSGYMGFLFYFLFSAVVTLVLLIKVNFTPKIYLVETTPIWKEGLFSSLSVCFLFSFIFFQNLIFHL